MHLYLKDWIIDRIEIKDPLSNKLYIFPCNKWLSKNKEDGEIGRDLYPLIDERSRENSNTRNYDNGFDFDERFDRNNKNRNIDTVKYDKRNGFREERDDFNYRERERELYSRSPRYFR